jgi:hypothetical protein
MPESSVLLIFRGALLLKSYGFVIIWREVAGFFRLVAILLAWLGSQCDLSFDAP